MILSSGIVGGYSAAGVSVGSGDYLSKSGSPTGIADGKEGTLSLWMKSPAHGLPIQYLITFGPSVRFGLRSTQTPGSQVAVFGISAAGASVLTLAQSTTPLDDTWHHLLFAWDLTTAANCKAYMDGSDNTNLVTRVDAAIDYADGNTAICGVSGANAYTGDVAEFWFDDAWNDITSATFREKFAKNGRPVFLGADGSRPTGAQPLLYFKGGASTFGTNLGTGGTFTENGTFTDASTKPSY